MVFYVVCGNYSLDIGRVGGGGGGPFLDFLAFKYAFKLYKLGESGVAGD